MALDAADGTQRWNVAAEHASTNLLGAGDATLLLVNVVDGYVFTDRAETSTVVDRAGIVLGSDLPGTAVLLTEDVLVLREGTGTDSTFGVYDRE